ncbi:MAG: hypothetical protein NW220_03795 [Leptolyngbyaceae cyanobacterium bins.349]|nr:hypothetical protein [Leptolyngbyaceae cyanobacterium bins.349]
MFAQTFYLVRSIADGQYLVAHLKPDADKAPTSQSYLLLFREHFEALTYLNTHGKEIAHHFAVESIPGSQLESLIKRWNFSGIGMVQDPIPPKIEFLSRSQGVGS